MTLDWGQHAWSRRMVMIARGMAEQARRWWAVLGSLSEVGMEKRNQGYLPFLT